jgi:hypothetical protein
MNKNNLRNIIKEELDKETRKYTDSLNRGTINMIKNYPQTKEILTDYLKDKNKKITDLSYKEAAELNIKVAEATGKKFNRIPTNSPAGDPRLTHGTTD